MVCGRCLAEDVAPVTAATLTCEIKILGVEDLLQMLHSVDRDLRTEETLVMYALSKDCASVPSLLAYSSQEVFVCGGVKEPSYFSLGPSSTLGNEKLLSLFYFPPKSHADASNKLLIRAFKRKAMVCVWGGDRRWFCCSRKLGVQFSEPI